MRTSSSMRAAAVARQRAATRAVFSRVKLVRVRGGGEVPNCGAAVVAVWVEGACALWFEQHPVPTQDAGDCAAYYDAFLEHAEADELIMAVLHAWRHTVHADDVCSILQGPEHAVPNVMRLLRCALRAGATLVPGAGWNGAYTQTIVRYDLGGVRMSGHEGSALRFALMLEPYPRDVRREWLRVLLDEARVPNAFKDLAFAAVVLDDVDAFARANASVESVEMHSFLQMFAREHGVDAAFRAKRK